MSNTSSLSSSSENTNNQDVLTQNKNDVLLLSSSSEGEGKSNRRDGTTTILTNTSTTNDLKETIMTESSSSSKSSENPMRNYHGKKNNESPHNDEDDEDHDDDDGRQFRNKNDNANLHSNELVHEAPSNNNSHHRDHMGKNPTSTITSSDKNKKNDKTSRNEIGTFIQRLEASLASRNSINNDDKDNEKNDDDDDDLTRERCKDTIQCIFEQLTNFADELIQDGLYAFQECERLSQKLLLVQKEVSNKTKEIDRLRLSEKKSRESITNLLRAVESSNEDVRDKSQSKLVEARIRSELLDMSSKRDQMEIDLAETQRKYKLVEDELSHVKGKLLKVQQEKKQMEKDQRATLSLAQTLQGNRHSETDYYKRKFTESQSQVQGLTAVLMEKNRQIEELRRQQDRDLSQHRLASYRSTTTTATTGSTATGSRLSKMAATNTTSSNQHEKRTSSHTMIGSSTSDRKKRKKKRSSSLTPP